MTQQRTLTQDEDLHFQAWRATALTIAPYFARALFAMTPVAVDDVDTFAIDDRMRVYINFGNCLPKGPRFCGEALLHEVGHIVGDHSNLAELAGVGDHEKRDWNLAGDYAVNDDLRDAGCSLLADHGVFAAQIGMDDYLTPLHYMGKLRQLRKNRPPRPQSGGTGEDRQGPTGRAGGQGGSLPPYRGCGSGSGGEPAPCELGGNDLGGEAPGLNRSEVTTVKVATAAAVKSHIDANGIGSVPAGLREMVDAVFAEAPTPWEQVLASYVRRAVAVTLGNTDTSYSRRNRRRLADELRTEDGQSRGRIIAPGNIRPVPRLHFYRDTSGSMSGEQLAAVTAEVEGIAKRLGIRGDELLVTDVDARIHGTRRYSGRASITEVHGRGGTDMGEAIRHACGLRKLPSCIVIATDGETGWPAEKPKVPVVVLLAGAGDRWRARVPGWAKVVEVPGA